jgi:hypothetical protein
MAPENQPDACMTKRERRFRGQHKMFRGQEVSWKNRFSELADSEFCDLSSIP